jgi:hypothetical protein
MIVRTMHHGGTGPSKTGGEFKMVLKDGEDRHNIRPGDATVDQGLCTMQPVSRGFFRYVMDSSEKRV